MIDTSDIDVYPGNGCCRPPPPASAAEDNYGRSTPTAALVPTPGSPLT